MLILSVVMGLVNVFVKKVFDVGVNYMIFVVYRMFIFVLILVLFFYIWERYEYFDICVLNLIFVILLCFVLSKFICMI